MQSSHRVADGASIVTVIGVIETDAAVAELDRLLGQLDNTATDFRKRGQNVAIHVRPGQFSQVWQAVTKAAS